MIYALSKISYAHLFLQLIFLYTCLSLLFIKPSLLLSLSRLLSLLSPHVVSLKPSQFIIIDKWLLVLIKYVCSKIVYFVFASFSEVKNIFRNLEIKNLSRFEDFSYDCPISHRNFDAHSMLFNGISVLFDILLKSIELPSKCIFSI